MMIVIDGPAGTGKSSVAKKVAKSLGFTFFDTGAMYRSFAWMVRENKIDPTDREAVCRLLPNFAFELKVDASEERRYFVSGTEVTQVIREPQISSVASLVSTYLEVRNVMVKIQRELGSGCNAVFEGRDMGTVVFPKADVKIFLTATPETRAKRRYDELLLKFPDRAPSLSLEQMIKEMEERDRNDSTRAVSPLKQASDAYLIDTSSMSIEEVVQEILQLVFKGRSYPKMKRFYAIIYWMARIFFKICFRLQIYGLDHFRPGSGIIVANHTSHFDPPVLSISCPEEVHFLAKESLFKIPLLGRLIRLLNSHPVSRSVADTSVFKELIRLLRAGKKIILFPEGSRSLNGMLQPLERGLSLIVQKGRCPIFPAYIQGTFDAWPQNRKFPKLLGKVFVVFGAPIEWDEFEGLDRRQAEEALMNRTTESLKELKSWLEKGSKGTPP